MVYKYDGGLVKFQILTYSLLNKKKKIDPNRNHKI